MIGLQARALPGVKQVQLEKFRAWSDCAGDIETVFPRDQLLANIGLYWVQGRDRFVLLGLLLPCA